VHNNIPTVEKYFLIEPEDANFKFMLSHLADLEQCVFYNYAIGYDSASGNHVRSSKTGGPQIENQQAVVIHKLERWNIWKYQLLTC
jgi:hypothetical protein